MIQRLHPEDSRNWAHGCYRMSSVYLHTLLIAFFFVTLGLFFATREMKVTRDNYNDMFFLIRSELTNSTDVTFDEISEALNDNNIMHALHTRDHIRYNFGTSHFNHCKVWPYDNDINFPSLLRRMTFSAATQSCVRAAVLISITVRVFAVYCRCSDIRLQTYNCITCLLSAISVVSELSTSVFGMFVTALHLDNDEKSMHFLVHNSLLMFGISFFVSAAVYTFLETFDQTRKNNRLLERVFCLVLFGTCFPFVNQNYTSFLLTKPCMVYVPMKVALCEYTCITSIILFYFTQFDDLRTYQIILSTERTETMCCMSYITCHNYNPAMLHDFNHFPRFSKEDEVSSMATKTKIDIGTPIVPHKSIIFVW